METPQKIVPQTQKTVSEKAYVNLVYTTSYFSAGFLQILKPYGLSEQQYNVLVILRESNPKPCTLSSISSRMIDKMSNATRLVDKLLLKGYVTRDLCPDNRRKVDIRITKSGIDLLNKLEPKVNEFIRGMMGSEEDAHHLSSILDKVRNGSAIELLG